MDRRTREKQVPSRRTDAREREASESTTNHHEREASASATKTRRATQDETQRTVIGTQRGTHRCVNLAPPHAVYRHTHTLAYTRTKHASTRTPTSTCATHRLYTYTSTTIWHQDMQRAKTCTRYSQNFSTHKNRGTGNEICIQHTNCCQPSYFHFRNVTCIQWTLYCQPFVTRYFDTQEATTCTT